MGAAREASFAWSTPTGRRPETGFWDLWICASLRLAVSRHTSKCDPCPRRIGGEESVISVYPSRLRPSPVGDERNHGPPHRRDAVFLRLPQRGSEAKSERGWVLSPLGAYGISRELVSLQSSRYGLRSFARCAGYNSREKLSESIRVRQLDSWPWGGTRGKLLGWPLNQHVGKSQFVDRKVSAHHGPATRTQTRMIYPPSGWWALTFRPICWF